MIDWPHLLGDHKGRVVALSISPTYSPGMLVRFMRKGLSLLLRILKPEGSSLQFLISFF